MSRNIKNIGKELLGRSLNSFHRKTGLTQLEENNKMQDGILDGILSQVDDAYIEKTEQSNVIHLDGSGDGVVVVDSIEGNTMVNLLKDLRAGGAWVDNGNKFSLNIPTGSGQPMILGNLNYELKKDTVYTVILNVVEYTTGIPHVCFMNKENNKLASTTEATTSSIGLKKFKLTTKSDIDSSILRILPRNGIDNTYSIGKDILILEGDWTNREISASYFEGLQSSFEEKVNSEGKYEIEILSHNINHFDNNKISLNNLSGWRAPTTITYSDGVIRANNGSDTDRNCSIKISIPTIYLTPRVQKVYISCMARVTTGTCNLGYCYIMNSKGGLNAGTSSVGDNTVTTTWKRITKVSTLVTDMMQNQYLYTMFGTPNLPTGATLEIKDIIVSYVEPKEFIPLKQNKIKLLLNEPLRALSNDIKDKLCIKDGRLVVERNCKTITFDGVNYLPTANNTKNSNIYRWTLRYDKEIYTNTNNLNPCICDRYTTVSPDETWGTPKYSDGICVNSVGNSILLYLDKYKDGSDTSRQNLINDLKTNPATVVYRAIQPVYEEVLNEYGEPIILEGYENGTLYIDSTIVPTTTVRYTPKMESLKTLKAVNHNNTMLTDDINNNIIDYMMNVDLMIMEKEMKNKKIRRIGEKDMTSMQKRTFDMLKRLIKGKTLTEQECKDRVVLYLSADKITSEQAEELMIYISEIYA